MASPTFRNNSSAPIAGGLSLPARSTQSTPDIPVIFGRIIFIDPSRLLARFRSPRGPDNPPGSTHLSSRAQARPIAR
jgi:hypothetical protein